MSTTETVLVIAVVGVVAYLVMRQQDADRAASAPASAPGPVMGRGKYDFFAELSEDVSGAISNLGSSYAEAQKQKQESGLSYDLERRRLEIEAAKAEAKKT
jgi:hypothetical protein